jgi:hypothetical protein
MRRPHADSITNVIASAPCLNPAALPEQETIRRIASIQMSLSQIWEGKRE